MPSKAINKMMSQMIVRHSSLILACVIALSSRAEEAALLNKSIFGASYDIAFSPQVGRHVVDGGPIKLRQFYRGSLEIMYPYFRYLALGVSIDYTLAISPNDNDPNLSFSKESAKIKSTFLGATANIRPQLPFAWDNTDLILYSQAQLGFGTSSPIAFGTQPLSDYSHKNTSNMPSPFPLMFETTPKIGLQLFGWRFIGVDLAFGYRILWVVHPMVSIPKSKLKEGMSKDSRSAIWYDVSSLFLQAGLKFAF
jgi:hypothetical protein